MIEKLDSTWNCHVCAQYGACMKHPLGAAEGSSEMSEKVKKLNPKLHVAMDDFGMAYGMDAAESRRTTAALLDVIRKMMIEAMRAEIQQTTQLMCGVQVIPRELPDMANAILYPETEDE